ncbi:urea ABC transporter permease subunit UrtB [Rhodobacteraceae bacterium 2CG4]|uniref:Urea ABC transporter permease subunit UrtB n=1 Tax=Halovulum marinum TaxID=2662447 RepID=A0A6L5Z640_9RHOB|nr:urea ABC transporter permease subunit UrtB [Halovulum marinum]MSU91540.1 urea ABC transporter permease subunit UrtB [Halovulum marinum]
MRLIRAIALAACLLVPIQALGQASPIQDLLQEHGEVIAKSSRKTIQPAIDALRESGLPAAQTVMERWQEKDLWIREADGAFFFVEKDGDTYTLLDIATGEPAGTADKSELKQLKPNSGIRGLIGAALVQFQLQDPNPASRRAALDAIARDPEASHLEALRGAIETEQDAEIRAAKERMERLLTIPYGDTDQARVAAIRSFDGDLGLDVRAALNPLLATRTVVVEGDAPEALNVARKLRPGGEELTFDDAYELLVSKDLAPPAVDRTAKRVALEANAENGLVAGFATTDLDTWTERNRAYDELAARGVVPADVPVEAQQEAVGAHSYYLAYAEPSAAITDAARRSLASIETGVMVSRGIDITLDALSLASLYFLAAIGLAITFGVMRVINMAHGEFIMMGAYTGYVVQQFVPNYTLSLVVALPLAFAVTFAAGVAMERLVIRWLYNRPLETLLATFGISIALQQLAKNIFGTQARPLTAPGWLDGALVFNDVISISYIRIAIFALGLIFLVLLLFTLNRTRLGLEVRAVTQNPRMAASMGINPDKINMLTFGLGSGIAGIAGVAIGLFAKVTSELGQDYIVQSFMTVVVGGVGNIWGTLAGAALIGFFQKGIEWFNPSNTLAAQTFMIVLIIIFIQFRPRGIIALKGRAAEA